MKTKYLIVTESIDPKLAQDMKDSEIEYAENRVREAQLELTDALVAPLVLERTRQIEVHPGHPDYDNASHTTIWRYYDGDLVWINPK